MEPRPRCTYSQGCAGQRTRATWSAGRLTLFPGLPALYEALSPDDAKAPVLTIDFRKGETSFRLFSTIATLGTPLDVTLQEIRVECFFPMDDPTAEIFRGWARGGGGPA